MPTADQQRIQELEARLARVTAERDDWRRLVELIREALRRGK